MQRIDQDREEGLQSSAPLNSAEGTESSETDSLVLTPDDSLVDGRP